MRQATSIILALTVLSLSSAVDGDVIRSPVAVIRNDLGEGAGSSINSYFDQSGLQTPYTSGVTDFDTYNPAAVVNTGNAGASWFGQEFTPGFTDFDLGQSELVTQLVTWTFAQGTDNQTGIIDVLISDDPTFSADSSAGFFTIQDNSDGTQTLGQVFDVIDTQGRYIRIDHLLSQGGTFRGGSEIAFATASAVPEPLPASMIVMLMFGWAWMSRRR